MVNILKEEINRIKELIFIKESEDEGLGKYMDSTYLKTLRTSRY